LNNIDLLLDLDYHFTDAIALLELWLPAALCRSRPIR